MTKKSISTAFKLSVGYFSLVLLLLCWLEIGIGQQRNGGVLASIVLFLITLPGVLLEGPVVEFFHCARYSLCEHLSGAIVGGGVNASLMYLFLRVMLDD